MKYHYFFLISIILSLTGCGDETEDSNSVYIGGQINNPETDYVIISKENETIDTLYLDGKNQFGKDYSNLKKGIYTFNHPPESQILYMEPGDSIIIYLNTLAFDESLNFSGEGADKSNFLLDMFLKNQQNNDLILTYYKIEPSQFARITDSIRSSRKEKLDRLISSGEYSEDFLKIAKASIDYEYYDLRERYSFLIRKYRKNFADKIPEDFNDYRENIDFNNRELQDYYVYTNLIDDYLRSKAIEDCTSKSNIDKKDCYNINSFENIERRIILIDSLSEIESLKNEFIDRLSAQAIVNAENEERINDILKLLEDLGHSHLNEAKKLADIQKSYLNGNSIANLWASNAKGVERSYGEILNRPTITYAWSLYAPAHHRWQHKIIKDLKNKYPQIDFLGINVDKDEREEWLRTLETFGYDKDTEYQIARRNPDKETYKRYLNKVFLVNKDGTIYKGDVQFGSPEFEEEINDFLDQ